MDDDLENAESGRWRATWERAAMDQLIAERSDDHTIVVILERGLVKFLMWVERMMGNTDAEKK